MIITISGGTGFVGTHLTRFFNEGDHICRVLTRNPVKYSERSNDLLSFHDLEDVQKLVEESDVVINLAGENLFDQRWTSSVKERILSSRIDMTRKLVSAISMAGNKPDVLISASGVDYYGDRGEDEITEDTPPDDGFLAEVCKQWENEALRADPHVRVVTPRFGIILEKDGGALGKMLTPFKLFAGGPLGDGTQYFPWIHMRDLCESIMFSILKTDIQGAYNATAPNPVTMKEFAHTLGDVMGRPASFPVPKAVLRVALGEAANFIVSSKRVIPAKLLEHGYKFRYAKVQEALENILDKRRNLISTNVVLLYLIIHYIQ